MSALPESPVLEYGRCMNVSVYGSVVLKTSIQGTNPARGAVLLDRLATYSNELSKEPIAVAPLYEANLTTIDASSHIQLKMGLVDGPSLLQLPEEDRHAAVGHLLQNVCEMTTRDSKGTLQVPIDATARNWHIENGIPTLVDIFPALVRDTDGKMPLIESHWTQGHWEKRFGTQQGVTCNALYSALSVANTANPGVRLRRALKAADDWCYDALPTNMTSQVKCDVERQIRHRFIPQLAGTAIRVAKNKVVTPIVM